MWLVGCSAGVGVCDKRLVTTLSWRAQLLVKTRHMLLLLVEERAFSLLRVSDVAFALGSLRKASCCCWSKHATCCCCLFPLGRSGGASFFVVGRDPAGMKGSPLAQAAPDDDLYDAEHGRYVLWMSPGVGSMKMLEFSQVRCAVLMRCTICCFCFLLVLVSVLVLSVQTALERRHNKTQCLLLSSVQIVKTKANTLFCFVRPLRCTTIRRRTR